MYIINDTYFQAPKYLIPNLEESDSKSFTELERIIDEMCRFFMRSILTTDELQDFNSYLVDGLFPTDTTGIPQKWIDLVKGKGDWLGLIQTNGTSKKSLLVDFVYHEWLIQNNTYITSFGDTKANPKGAENVNPTQRIVNVWNDFVEQYQTDSTDPHMFYVNSYCLATGRKEQSLLQFLELNSSDYVETKRPIYSIKNQLGI